MENLENYWLLFTDSFFANIAITSSSEMAFKVMQSFGGYDQQMMLLFAIGGFVAASLVNYYLGRVIFNIYRTKSSTEHGSNFAFIQKIMQKYGMLVLCFNLVDVLGNLITVLAAFSGLSLRKILSIIVFVRFIYYSTHLFL